MPENNEPSAGQEATAPTKGRPTSKTVIVLIVAALFLGLIVGKLVTAGDSSTSAPSGVTAGDASITSGGNDATADYGAALKSGTPIYLLFHSST